MTIGQSFVTREIRNCARCGGTHVVTFRPLDNASDEYSWWATCPVKFQPILMKIMPEPRPQEVIISK